MRVITLKVNGIRSAASKGLYRWLAAQRADMERRRFSDHAPLTIGYEWKN